MIKKILLSIIFLLLLIGGGVFFYFDSIVKNAIEVVGSQVLGTAVTVSSASVSPLNGSGNIRGLRIENPQGFDSDYVIELESVSIAMNVRSIFSEVVEIESISIVQPAINYETKISSDNIRALLGNLSRGDAATAEESSAGKQIIIRRLEILDPQLNLIAAFVTAPVSLPDIEMQDIGAEGDGSSVAAAVSMVLVELSGSILKNLPNMDDLAESVEAGLQDGVEQVEDAVDDAVEKLSGRLRGILN
jgi:hypothetical protein